MSGGGAEPPEPVTAALAALGKRRLALAIHDASFPGQPSADPGRGTRCSAAGRGFVRFARRLGFDGLVLGPQGVTSADNASPYDGTLFSRNPLDIDFPALGEDPPWAGLAVDPPPLAHDGDAGRVRHRAVHAAAHAALARLHGRLLAARERGSALATQVDRALAAFRARHREWLEDDALYLALSARQGGWHHRDWPDPRDRRLLNPPAGEEAACRARAAVLRRELATEIERHCLGQLLVHRQHAAFRAEVNALGVRLYGDLQIGLSACDEWQREPLFLAGYRLGAPPSRTNPDGQPWGYRLLDPALYRESDGRPGPAMRFLRLRVEKVLDEVDGLRIDHPHGLVCPWVYRADDPDPFRAVRAGARLFASPDLADHAELARHAIARPAQLARDPAVPRHADGWVRDLDETQVARYAALFDLLVEAVRARGAGTDEIVCEVLSTCPYPLARVMQRHGLGRFRVTQKMSLADAADVYRGENARPADWIMTGNHDTPPVWALARGWAGTPAGRERAEYLAQRLRPRGEAGRFAAELAGDACRLAEASLADLFASPAAHVMVFFTDLLGMTESYNRPGTVDEHNWSLRVPPDFARRYAEAAARGAALNLPRVLAMALRARGCAEHGALLEQLDALAAMPAAPDTP